MAGKSIPSIVAPNPAPEILIYANLGEMTSRFHSKFPSVASADRVEKEESPEDHLTLSNGVVVHAESVTFRGRGGCTNLSPSGAIPGPRVVIERGAGSGAASTKQHQASEAKIIGHRRNRSCGGRG